MIRGGTIQQYNTKKKKQQQQQRERSARAAWHKKMMPSGTKQCCLSKKNVISHKKRLSHNTSSKCLTSHKKTPHSELLLRVLGPPRENRGHSPNSPPHVRRFVAAQPHGEGRWSTYTYIPRRYNVPSKRIPIATRRVSPLTCHARSASPQKHGRRRGRFNVSNALAIYTAKIKLH